MNEQCTYYTQGKDLYFVLVGKHHFLRTYGSVEDAKRAADRNNREVNELRLSASGSSIHRRRFDIDFNGVRIDVR